MDKDIAPILCTKIDGKAGDWPSESFVQLFRIARECVQKISLRPEMTQVRANYGFFLPQHSLSSIHSHPFPLIHSLSSIPSHPFPLILHSVQVYNKLEALMTKSAQEYAEFTKKSER